MIGKKIIKVEPITNFEAKEFTEKIQKSFEAKEKELPYELQQTKEYLLKFGKTDDKELKSKLKDLKIPEKVCIELLNVRPKQEECVKTILLKRYDFDDDLVKKILEIFK